MSAINSSTATQFGPLIENPSAGGGGNWERTAVKVGSALDKAETNLLKAFSFRDEKDPGFKAFLKNIGMSANTSLQGLQLALQIRYDQAKQIFNTLSQILFAKNNTEEKVIEKIGR